MDDNKMKSRTFKIFGQVFKIKSSPILSEKKNRRLGWEVVVIMGKTREKYKDYVKDRLYATEASFHYFIEKHCKHPQV